MASARKTTSLLSWMPAQGTPGQRHARAALARAFADVAALPENRTGRVRAALADIAERAAVAYGAKVADTDTSADTDADTDAPAPAKAPAKATGKVEQQYCRTCRIPFRNTLAEHKRTAKHRTSAKASAKA